MNELAALITAGTGLITAIGAAIAFIWRKIEARLTALETRGENCELRSAKQVTVIELLWQEIERLAPDGSKVLARAHKLLGDLKEIV